MTTPADTYTKNINLDLPANGSHQNSWDQPVNMNFSIIDAALGSTAAIGVSGVPAGAYALGVAQYQCARLYFFGTLTGALTYYAPANVARMWQVTNGCTGTGSITLASAGGGANVTVVGNAIFYCDGANVIYADQQFAIDKANSAQTASESYAAAQATAAQTNAESYAAAQATAAQTNAESYAAAQASAAQTNAENYAAAQASAAQSAATSAAENFAVGTHNFPAGWAKAPSGFIVQGGVASATSATPGTFVTFPTAFPTACISVVCNAYNGAATAYIYGTATTTGFSMINGVNSTNSWIAIGY